MGRYFGVEIECWSPPHTPSPTASAARLLTENGVSTSARGYFQRNAHRNWSAKTDGSIGYDRGVELVSPKLKDARGRAEVVKVVDLLRTNGYVTNQRCGIHVHVDARDLSPAEQAAVVWRYGQFETEIMQHFPEHRQNNPHYCPAMSSRSMQNAWNLVVGSAASYMRPSGIHGTRYASVNTMRLGDLGTIEFRMHESTLDSARVASWIAFLVFFVNETVAKMRTPRNGEAAPAMVVEPVINPYRSGTKNALCCTAVIARRTTAAELASLTGWEMATISSMISDIRSRGINVVREGRGANATYHVPVRMTTGSVATTTATQFEIRGYLTDGLPEFAVAWLTTSFV